MSGVPPLYLLMALGGALLIVVGAGALLFRLGGFTPTDRERRAWFLAGAVLVPVIVLLAFVGPLPTPLVLALNAGLLVYWVWAWRTGRLRVDRAPSDMRDEVARRRAWMLSHRGTLVLLWIGATIATVLWVVVIAALIAP